MREKIQSVDWRVSMEESGELAIYTTIARSYVLLVDENIEKGMDEKFFLTGLHVIARGFEDDCSLLFLDICCLLNNPLVAMTGNPVD
jgi:hypothetical protein